MGYFKRECHSIGSIWPTTREVYQGGPQGEAH